MERGCAPLANALRFSKHPTFTVKQKPATSKREMSLRRDDKNPLGLPLRKGENIVFDSPSLKD